MADLKSEGKCVFCQNIYSRTGISRHLNAHLEKLEKVEKRKSFHLRVDANPYFLNLLMDGDAVLEELDDFLRAIWLECCGHMSQFGYERWGGNELRKTLKSRRVFDKDVKLWYAYDFGSTTELDIKCLGVYPVAVKEGIQLLSRNEPLDILCDTCAKQPAVEICTAHWDETDTYFCEDCAELHEEECPEAEYAMMPFANSPRMGVCGYTGGQIDMERDRRI